MNIEMKKYNNRPLKNPIKFLNEKESHSLLFQDLRTTGKYLAILLFPKNRKMETWDWGLGVELLSHSIIT